LKENEELEVVIVGVEEKINEAGYTLLIES
jgi:hypothetical protein